MDNSKVALITGGASGIGLELVKHLHSKGWNITISDIDAAKGQEVALALGKQVQSVQSDATNYDQLSNVFASTFSKWHRLDFVAANAGITETRPSLNDYASVSATEGLPPPKPNLKTMEVNLTAQLWTVWLASHYMRNNVPRGGKIIVTASSAAIYPIPFQPQYTASKHALVGLVRSLAPIYIQDRITINAFLPGLVLTGLTRGANALPEFLTPGSTLTKACDRFLEGDETGCCAELSKDKIFLREQAEYPDEMQRRVMTKLAESATPDFTVP